MFGGTCWRCLDAPLKYIEWFKAKGGNGDVSGKPSTGEDRRMENEMELQKLGEASYVPLMESLEKAATGTKRGERRQRLH